MTTLLAPTRPPGAKPGRARIVERTTTITREIFLDDPTPAPTDHPAEGATEATHTTGGFAERISGIDRAVVRLGIWLIELGRRRALRPAARSEEIVRRLEESKSRDMKHFIGLPN